MLIYQKMVRGRALGIDKRKFAATLRVGVKTFLEMCRRREILWLDPTSGPTLGISSDHWAEMLPRLDI